MANISKDKLENVYFYVIGTTFALYGGDWADGASDVRLQQTTALVETTVIVE